LTAFWLDVNLFCYKTVRFSRFIMEATLQALGGILLKAVPTFLLVVLLHFYLKGVFFNPLRKVLRQRYEATEGARKLAAESLERAAAKTADYEAAMRAARTEIYQAQEQAHKRLQENELAELTAARRRAEAAVEEAKSLLSLDVEAAKAGLARDSELLADQIAESILRGRAA
jgi:F-type H+-transporting ATPase subunit b